jgi:hypothetical protein
MQKYFLILWISVASCSPTLRVQTDYDRDYNVRTFTTYQWDLSKDIESGQNPLYYNELNDKRIRSIANLHFQNKGYQLTEDSPQMLVHYHIIVEDRSSIRTEPYGYYGPYWRRMRTDVYEYREGTLILDVMDADNKHLIWRGWATSTLNRSYDSKQMEERIALAVERIMSEFPAVARK